MMPKLRGLWLPQGRLQWGLVSVLWVLALAASVTEASVTEVSPSADEAYDEIRGYTTPLPETNEAVQTLRADFDRLVTATGTDGPEQLYVGPYGGLAVTLPKFIIVASNELVDLPLEARMFVLAHELGHARLRHLQERWSRRHAHRQEFEADAFAAKCLQTLGLSVSAGLSVLEAHIDDEESSEHPSVRNRLARLARYRNPVPLTVAAPTPKNLDQPGSRPSKGKGDLEVAFNQSQTALSSNASSNN